MSSANRTEAVSPPETHHNNFNFLRIVFASLVVLCHSPELIDGDDRREILVRLFHTINFGDVAVDCFFILSGYLIVKSWQFRPVAADYLKKRILRIVPGFYAAYLISVFLVGPLSAGGAAAYFADIQWQSLFSHLFALNAPPVNGAAFHGLTPRSVDRALWTIQYEVGCYLLVMGLGIAGVLRNRRVFAALFLLSTVFYWFAHHKELVMVFGLFGSPFTWARLTTFFLAGGCFYLYRDRIAYRPQWAAVAFLVLIATLFKAGSQIFVMPLCLSYLLFFAGFYPAPRLAKIGTKADLSYGLYLYAWPVQNLIIQQYRAINPWLLCLVSLAITSVFAWLSWTLIEKPALSLKPRPKAAV